MGEVFRDLSQGQNDSHAEVGLPFGEFYGVQNTRFHRGFPQRRAGWRRVAVAGTDAKCLDLTAASSEFIEIPIHSIHELKPPFSIETVFAPDTVTGTQYLQGFKHATNFPFQFKLDGDDLVVTFTKSGSGTEAVTAADLLAIGTTVYARVTVNNDGDINLYLDDDTTAAATSAGALDGETLITPGGAMQLGTSNNASFFDGKIDYFRACRGVVPDASLAFTRHPTPKAGYMLWDYGGNIDANDFLIDRSPYENHGAAINSPSEATSLCVNPAPVQAIQGQRDKDNIPKLLVVAGGRIHLAEV